MVAELVDQVQKAGEFQAVFNASGMPSGFYLVRLQVGRQVLTESISSLEKRGLRGIAAGRSPCKIASSAAERGSDARLPDNYCFRSAQWNASMEPLLIESH